eukprot:TRINITY_DN5670_c0_g1_i3.p1 TRINITY_DN5670_c0_g1~~TRINITY_DN5670_c0_g1_i3.p1  ORF type:complete len:841 (-),score=315.30 TRINITY_DN5670_c0_g1_i3:549-3071(-)
MSGNRFLNGTYGVQHTPLSPSNSFMERYSPTGPLFQQDGLSPAFTEMDPPSPATERIARQREEEELYEDFKTDESKMKAIRERMGDVDSPKTNNLKEMETRLETLQKENFSLKLKLYYMQERMTKLSNAGGDEKSADVLEENINLKVLLEERTKENEEKNSLLGKAKKALESLQVQLEQTKQQSRQRPAPHNIDLHKMEQNNTLQKERIRTLQNELEELKADYERRLQAQEEQLKNRSDQSDESRRREIENIEKEMEDLHAMATARNDENEQLKSTVSELEEQLRQAKEHQGNFGTVRQELLKLQDKLRELQEQVRSRDKEIRSLRELVQEKDHQSKLRESNFSSLSSELEAKHNELEQLNAQLDEKTRVLEETLDTLEGVTYTNTELNQHNNQLEQTLQRVQDEKQALTLQCEQIKRKLEVNMSEYDNVSKQLQDIMKENETTFTIMEKKLSSTLVQNNALKERMETQEKKSQEKLKKTAEQLAEEQTQLKSANQSLTSNLDKEAKRREKAEIKVRECEQSLEALKMQLEQRNLFLAHVDKKLADIVTDKMSRTSTSFSSPSSPNALDSEKLNDSLAADSFSSFQDQFMAKFNQLSRIQRHFVQSTKELETKLSKTFDELLKKLDQREGELAKLDQRLRTTKEEYDTAKINTSTRVQYLETELRSKESQLLGLSKVVAELEQAKIQVTHLETEKKKAAEKIAKLQANVQVVERDKGQLDGQLEHISKLLREENEKMAAQMQAEIDFRKKNEQELSEKNRSLQVHIRTLESQLVQLQSAPPAPVQVARSTDEAADRSRTLALHKKIESLIKENNDLRTEVLALRKQLSAHEIVKLANLLS